MQKIKATHIFTLNMYKAIIIHVTECITSFISKTNTNAWKINKKFQS